MKRIILRPVLEKDIQFLYEQNTQCGMGDWQGFKFESFEKYRQQYKLDGFCSSQFQIFIFESKGTPCGFATVRFHSIEVVEIGISMQLDFRGKGLCYVALLILLEYLFDNFQVERVEANTDAENIAAKRVLEQSSFFKEGVLRHRRFHHGKYHDSVIYSLLRHEWQSLRSQLISFTNTEADES
jgi:diamine N-acetyltransferase